MGRPPYPDLYEVLGVPPTASQSMVDDACRALRDDADAERAGAATIARAVLASPSSRALYDRLALGITPEPDSADSVIAPERDAVTPVASRPADRAMRYVAVAALVVSIVFLVAVLLA